MNCIFHNEVAAVAYCQSCGKALCAGCVRGAAGGQLFCDPCWRAWQSYQQPFAVPTQPSSGPNPSTAAVLGLIPGVGAMYNGQFFKGLIHVVVFAVLVSIASNYGIFGIFIGAWVLYQAFEAYHTARAMREGQPLPDPLGLNEMSKWLNLGAKLQSPWQPGAGPQTTAGQVPDAPPQAGYPPPPSGPYQAPYSQVPYPQENWPMSPHCWRGKEPFGAVILIGLGLMFLLDQFGHFFHFLWPIFLIGLGIWLIVHRTGNSRGGSL